MTRLHTQVEKEAKEYYKLAHKYIEQGMPKMAARVLAHLADKLQTANE